MAIGCLIIKAGGGLTTVQDQGRGGLAFYAIPCSGAMDGRAARLANVLVRNSPASPVIECTLVAPRLEFQTRAAVVLTGADFGWRVGGTPVERHRVIELPAGSLLSGEKAREGCRGYIAIAGQWRLHRQLGSYSSYGYAGLGLCGGRPLRQGDELTWEQPAGWPLDVTLVEGPLTFVRPGVVRMVPGPEFDWLDDASKQILTGVGLSGATDRISHASNRMGARLEGPPLAMGGKTLFASVPVLPGMVQLPPSGQPIVVLQDGQTTGGYPRIGYIPRHELAVFNQIVIGEEVWLHVE